MPVAKPKVVDLLERLGAVWESPNEFTLRAILRDAKDEIRRGGESMPLALVAAGALDRLGDVQSASSYRRDAVRLAPDDVSSQINLGVCYLKLSEPVRGRDALLAAADLAGEAGLANVVLLTNLAEAFWLSDEREKAVKCLELADSAANVEDRDHLWRLADAHAALENHLHAAALLARFLSRGSAYPERYGAPDAAWMDEQLHEQDPFLTRSQRRSLTFAADFATASAAVEADTTSMVPDPEAEAIFEGTRWLRARANQALLG